MAVILVSGTTAAQSSTFTVAAGSSATVFLTDAAGPMVNPDSIAYIQIQATNAEFYTIGRMDNTTGFAIAVTAPGTYRVDRPASAAAFAVEQV